MPSDCTSCFLQQASEGGGRGVEEQVEEGEERKTPASQADSASFFFSLTFLAPLGSFVYTRRHRISHYVKQVTQKALEGINYEKEAREELL